MRIILFGPPGAGKGTQAGILAEQFCMVWISTGEILRTAAAHETLLGKKAKPFLERGDLVPDSVISGIVREQLESLDSKQGFVLDGFPRNVNQAKTLEEMLKALNLPLTAVVEIQVPFDEIVKRLSVRRSCPHCSRVFSGETDFSLCPNCGKKLMKRADDREEVIRKRFAIYENEKQPLLRYYKEKGLLLELDGSLTIENVSKILRKELARHEENYLKIQG